METTNDPNERLIPFLRDLASSIESQKLAPRQLQSIGEFFMAYQFQKQAVKDQDSSAVSPPRFSKEELIKFLSLGWYVYQVLLRGESLPPSAVGAPSSDILD